MLHLIWGLLNIGLIISFIVTCFKATKLVREKLGLFSSIIFVFGLLSFAGHSNRDYNNKELNSSHVKIWKFSSEDTLSRINMFFMSIDLEKTLVSKFTLDIKYGKQTQGQDYIPVSASSSITGFVSGTSWRPISVVVNKAYINNRFEYFVNGVLEWRLLGATFYSQPKKFKGIAVTK